ncbi:MAG TPA: hypothetical protein GYA07_02190 [Verrucomicrobia bacterium]|nr:hypothetical protein [Verrucomicrobiota bacterium]HOP96030.1 hypothetical protein [Verrucomicrobiota bacterium]HPU55871.1 hypothetical protein [Verrucomicrobiota bacterium]
MKPNPTTSRLILVCFAVPEEAAPLAKAPLAPDIECLVTGIGKINAGRRVRAAIAARTPALVLTCGFAGALDPELRIGDVLFDEDPECDLAPVLRRLGAIPGTFHSADRVAVSANDKARLRQLTGAHAVEMESGAIRRICREHGVPSATVRAISDVTGEDLPLDFNRLVTPDGKIPTGAVIAAVLRSPGSIPGLLRLRRNTLTAGRRLAEILRGLLESVRTSGA